MDKDKLPVGQRFSQVYLEKGKPLKDSKRFRHRLGAYFEQNIGDSRDKLAAIIEKELGVTVPTIGLEYYDFSVFFKKRELRDVLDAITLIYQYFKEIRRYRLDENYKNWLDFVQRTFKEESLGYRVDDGGGVHFFIDEEFERSRAATISCLSEARYSAVSTAFEKCYYHLDSDPPNTKDAVRSISEALEILYKLIIDATGTARLNSSGVRSNLKPIVKKMYSTDKTASKAGEHLLDGFCDWIDASHMYRHGQKVKEPIEPPIGLAINMISSGSAYLRWLVEMDAFKHPGKN